MNGRVWAACISLFLLLGGCLADEGKSGPNAAMPPKMLVFPAHNLSFSVELAMTPSQIERGLMGRTHLDEKAGMLFDLGRQSRSSFWMYRTLIPLDAVFLDERMRVVDVQTMVPCTGEEAAACPVYAPKADMRYVLEINGGGAKKWGIKEGDLARRE